MGEGVEAAVLFWLLGEGGGGVAVQEKKWREGEEMAGPKSEGQ